MNTPTQRFKVFAEPDTNGRPRFRVLDRNIVQPTIFLIAQAAHQEAARLNAESEASQ